MVKNNMKSEFFCEVKNQGFLNSFLASVPVLYPRENTKKPLNPEACKMVPVKNKIHHFESHS